MSDNLPPSGSAPGSPHGSASGDFSAPSAGAPSSGAPAAKSRKFRLRPRVVIAVVLVAALVTFVVQNRSEVPVSFLVFEVNWPLWAVIITAAVAGAVISEVFGWVLRLLRRRRRDRRP